MSELVAGGALPLHRATDPEVRALDIGDISAALTEGLRDFRAAPLFGLLIGAVYAIGGNLLVWLAMSFDMVFLVYPLAAGFALIAPFAATGCYEASRRIAAGRPVGVFDLVGAVPAHARRELAFMALVAVFGLIGWIYAAGFVYALFFGLRPVDYTDIVTVVATTPRGIAFFLAGNAVGAVMASVIFAVSVVSYPMLLDRDVDFVTAMITSIRVVAAAPLVLLGWGIFIATLLAVALLPMFLGLVVVLPLLGHATWHLYTRAVGK